MRKLFAIVIAFASANIAPCALAQPLPQRSLSTNGMIDNSTPTKTPRFEAPANSTTEIEPQVTNGTKAEYKDWPATLLSDDTGCTVTAVGPRAFLMAAHCLKFVGLKPVIVAEGQERYVTCEKANGYDDAYDTPGKDTDANWDSISRDYALCLIDDPRMSLKTTRFETIQRSTVVSFGDAILLLGYGCNGSTILSGGHRTLRTATARVTRLPQGQSNFIELSADGGQNNGILCKGDSGGAAFWPATSGQRKIVAVNARTGLKDDRVTLNGLSFVSSMSTKFAYDFTREWATKHNVSICGAGASNANCRN
jgi:hypothetical protein